MAATPTTVIWTRMLRRFAGWRKTLDVSPNDPDLRLRFSQALGEFGNLVQSHLGACAKAGRALNIYKQTGQALATGDAKMVSSALARGIPVEQALEVLNNTPNDPLQQFRQLRDLAREHASGGSLDLLHSYFVNNLLSGPKTAERKVLSDTINLALRAPVTLAASAVDRARVAVRGGERTVFAGEVPGQEGTQPGEGRLDKPATTGTHRGWGDPQAGDDPRDPDDEADDEG